MSRCASGSRPLRQPEDCSSDIPMLPQAKLDALVARHAEIQSELTGSPDRDTYVRLSREYAELGPLVDTVKTYRAAAAELKDLDALLADPQVEPEMRELAAA